MFPGGMNPKKMKQMMKQLGMSMEQIEDVQKIIIVTPKGNYVFDSAEVTAMTMQGVTTFQIAGQPRFEESAPQIPEDDVKLVMDQTGSTREAAAGALTETKGDIAEAILRLSPK
ncbi:MAG: nascent polypeptide-associated complex protein [Methanoregulaceae archaeon]|nr:nascent polypeptide-associated complex protein [Methanoregulaceae archaeon]